jgi:hypothetical protein
MRSGERKLALDLLPTRITRYGVRRHLIRSFRRGRDFARHICNRAMRSWTAARTNHSLKPTHEIRTTNRNVGANVLAA